MTGPSLFAFLLPNLAPVLSTFYTSPVSNVFPALIFPRGAAFFWHYLWKGWGKDLPEITR